MKEIIDEQFQFDFDNLQSRSDDDIKKPGMIVETKTGLIGRTYNHEPYTDAGKQLVYTTKGKMLCDPASLKIKGFID